MRELELENLLKMSALASTVNSCETYIQRLETLKRSIQRLVNTMGRASIDQINSIDLMISKLDRKADQLEGEEQAQRADSLAEVRARETDKYLVKPVVPEEISRQSYRK